MGGGKMQKKKKEWDKKKGKIHQNVIQEEETLH